MVKGNIISADKLFKSYKLYSSPLDRIKEAFDPLRRKFHHDFYALKNISFSLEKGEVLGIIGKNGSGKSTLLKILSGVLTPTSGSIVINGKVSALLELGSGFNPELSGIENVYFNGLLMGYTHEEMNECLDSILAFADIGEFVYQPIKTYSSGMFVRLAFAVAINVDPDILIVDEALAVGDELFQKKCFSKINEFKENGKTILFVSHGTSSIIELCTKAMIIDDGELLVTGKPKQIISMYQKLLYSPASERLNYRDEIKSIGNSGSDINYNSADPKSINTDFEACLSSELLNIDSLVYESNGAIIEDPNITTVDGKCVNLLVRGGEYVFTYNVKFHDDSSYVRFAMMIKTLTGLEVYGCVSHAKFSSVNQFYNGQTYRQSFRFKCSLLPGTYLLNAGVLGVKGDHEVYLHRIIDIAMFKVQEEPNLLISGIIDLS